jgi:hypothetical protein
MKTFYCGFWFAGNIGETVAMFCAIPSEMI